MKGKVEGEGEEMKIARYLYLLFIIVMYVVNYFYLKINVFTFTGIVLASLIGIIIAVNIYVKLKNKKEGLHGDDFIFSPEVASTLRKIDIGIQLESSIIATFFLIVGLLLFTIYTIFFTQYQLVMKIFLTFNSFFAMILMGSMLITNYQQLMSYKESTKMLKMFTETVGNKTMKDMIEETPKDVYVELTDEESLKKMFERRNE